MDVMRRARIALVAVAALAWAIAVATPRRVDLVLAPLPATLDASSVLPAGLRLPAADAARHIVNAVATDIDADGDLDVVTTDGSLGVAVWVNDGTGQLTRKQPLPATGWGTDPPPPAVSGGAAIEAVTIQTPAPSLDLPVDGARIALAASPRVRAPSTLSDTSVDASASSPRAPPALL